MGNKASGNFDVKKALGLADTLEAQKQQNPQVIPELIVIYEQLLPHLEPGELQAGVFTDLGNAYYALLSGTREMNLRKAIGCYEQALQFRTPDSTPLDYAKTLCNLGVSYSELPSGDRNGNINNAIKCFHEALRFFTEAKTPTDYASIQNNLGLAYSYLLTGNRNGNLLRAVECYHNALKFWNTDTAPVNYAMAQNNLGNAYRELHAGGHTQNLNRAIEHFNQALQIFTPENAPYYYAIIQNNLGNVYCELSVQDRSAKLTKAINCYTNALQIFTRTNVPFYYATLQNNLAFAYNSLPSASGGGNLKQAIECLQNALKIFTPDMAPLHYAEIQNNLGFAYKSLATGANFEKAVAHFNQALQFRTPDTAPFDCRRTLRNLGDLYFSRKEWATALTHYRKAMEVGEFLYQAGLSTEIKATEVFENVVIYRKAAYAAAHLGSERANEALIILERGKTRLLTETLQLHPSRPDGVPDQQWLEYTQARDCLQSIRMPRSYSGMEQNSESLPEYESRKVLVQKARENLDRAIEQLRRHAPGFLEPIDSAMLYGLITDETAALISFCLTEHGSLGFVVTKNQGLQVIAAPDFTDKLLEKLLNQEPASGFGFGGWAGAYLNRRNYSNQWPDTMTKVLTVIGERLLTPILKELPARIRKLILIPTGGLFLLPLHAAPVRLPGRDLSYVGEYYQVSYAPSANVLAECQDKLQSKPNPAIYAVINPGEDPELRCTSIEGIGIAQYFSKRKIHYGRNGIKPAVLTEIPHYSYLHFSCHGSYDWDNPSESGISLASAGKLTLAELRTNHQADISGARLVVLSACESGMSDVFQGGGDEYVGLAAGFLMAGVPCVLSSLWAVADASTTILMERFYYYHLQEKQCCAEALRQAQDYVRQMTAIQVVEFFERYLKYLSSMEEKDKLMDFISQFDLGSTTRPFEHPVYWAAFTVNGM